MSTGPKRADYPVPPNAVCVHCGRRRGKLQWCRMTGSGDHPRHFLLCDECIKTIFTRSPQSDQPAPPPSPIMTEEERKQELRRQNAFERLGTDDPVCACCGETDWRCMELHHLEGKDFGATLIIVCRNCHRKLSDAQKDHPARFGPPPNDNESLAHLLQGIADFLNLLAGKLRELAAHLVEQARRPLATPERP